MDTSSEDSFAWTNASSDDSDTMAVTGKINGYEDESDSGKKFKKKLQKELLLETESPSKGKKSKRKTDENSSSELDFKETHVKLEPDSDIDFHKKKKKKKEKSKHKFLNGTNSETESTFDKFLDIRVKEEQLSSSSFKKPKSTNDEFINEPIKDESISNGRKKKSNNKKSLDVTTTSQESDSAIDNNHTWENTEEDYVRKKKKSKKSKHKSEENEPLILVDKFSADETTVEEPPKKKRKKRDKTSVHESQIDTEAMDVDDTDTNEISNIFPDTVNNSMNNEKYFQDQDKEHDKSKENKKISKISDRITFEEDDNSEIEALINMSQRENSAIEDTLYTTKQSNQYQHFLKTNKQLQQFPIQYKSEYLVHKDDEIWLIKCPQEIDIKKFKNVDLKLENKCKLKIEGQTYEGNVDSETSRLALLTAIDDRLTIQNKKVKGIIQLRRRIPKPHYFEDNIITNNQTNFIPLPETKCRHPLFGPDYKKAIKISPTTQERLHNPVNVTHKIKKKKKKDKHHNMETETKSEVHSQEEYDVKHKKSRKRKHDVEEYTPKTKKVKRDPESAEAWESEKAIEENLFDF